MRARSAIQQLAENLWLLPFPFKLAGCHLGRNVTIIRLASGRLIIHSTAPFKEEHLAAIRELGTPAWLVESTMFHDTFAAAGRSSFPNLPYLAPPGFPASPKSVSLLPPPPEWEDEIGIIELQGMPRVREHVTFHRPSGTLIVADLVFNLAASGWTRLFMRALAGMKEYPSMSRFFRFMIKDREAFQNSLDSVRRLPFQRIVVGHGEPIETDARQAFDSALGARGF